MKSRNMYWSMIIFFTLLLANAAVGHAAATMTVSRSGNGQFIVQGTGFEGVAGIEINLRYDYTVLKNPRVEQGGLIASSQMVNQTNEAGKVHIASIEAYPKTLSGTGTIATVVFDSSPDSCANITAISARIVDVKGSTLSLSPPAVPAADPSCSSIATATANATTPAAGPITETTSGATTGAVAGAAPSARNGGSLVWLESVSMSAEGKTVDPKQRDEASVPAPVADKIPEKSADSVEKDKLPPTGETAKQEASLQKSGAQDKNILEQFRLFQGEKTAKNLIALFAGALEGSRQEPLVALSDGNSVVKVLIDISAARKTAPNFALQGVKLVSIKIADDSRWVIEVLPSKGVFDAEITVLQEGTLRQIPLTVVPPLPADFPLGKGDRLTEADITQFLKERGTEKAPRFDLNGDGKRDFIDEYILTANYLLKLDSGKKTAVKVPQ